VLVRAQGRTYRIEWARPIWDDILDTDHAVVTETYIERWSRRDRPPEKESEAAQAGLPEHGTITAAAPRARYNDRFTIPFEDYAAWLAAQMPWAKAAGDMGGAGDTAARVSTDVAGRDARLGAGEASRPRGLRRADWNHAVVRVRAPQALICLIKGQPREAFKVRGDTGKAQLAGLIAWAGPAMGAFVPESYAPIHLTGRQRTTS
jgi:hypothetical protein